MPISDEHELSAGISCLSTPMLSKNLKMSYDERITVSRKLFNLSRKRVESLKRSYDIKRSKNTEKPIDARWITSATYGSRDAVLVFRTDPLNRSRKDEASKTSDSAIVENPSSQNVTDDSKNNAGSLESNCAVGYDSSSDDPLCVPSIDMHKSYDDGVLTDHEKLNSDMSSSENLNKKSHFSVQASLRKIRQERLKKIFASSDKELHSCGSSDSVFFDAEPICEKGNFSDNCDVEGEVEEEEEDGHNNSRRDEQEQDFFGETSENWPLDKNMPAAQLKITYKFIQTETKLLRSIFSRHGLSEADDVENFSILWTGVHLKPDILRNLSPYQRVNHFPRSYELTRKDRLYKNIERMQHLRGFKHFDIVPQSFILPVEYKDLVAAHHKSRGPWIVKPAASSRGRGIFIVNSPDQIPHDEQVLVSKYIADPLCIDGHKCDVRVYVLVTSFDPLIIYIYEEGLVRLATVKYDRKTDNLWNPCMHLCNYSINKYHSDYIKSSDVQDEDVGHKWTLSALLRHMKSQGCNIRLLMSNIEDLIIKSILASAQSIISACRMFVPNGTNCFELYGFDILIDDSLKPWLLEINLSPSMGVDSVLDAKVKSCLIVDLLTLVGIPAYSPTMRADYDSKWTRFRNINYARRTTSADPVGVGNNNTGSKRSASNRLTKLQPLTMEEVRIVRNARFQYARRGGFVRIFPTGDSMQRYGSFLDSATGIPVSTQTTQGNGNLTMILPHNYNQMLYNNLFGKDQRAKGVPEENSRTERMSQYERALDTELSIVLPEKRIAAKCEEKGRRLRQKIVNLIDGGSEMTSLQARQTFSQYLIAIMCRLIQEPRPLHEKNLLKFINRVGGSAFKTPAFFRNPDNFQINSKTRLAMLSKLVNEFLELYNRDTESYVDTIDEIGMIPTKLFNEFLSQAQESDLEAVLTFHTNLTGTMPYLYNRCAVSIPPTPPIPIGLHGFLKVLPAMVAGGAAAREFNKSDSYYRNSDREIAGYKCESYAEGNVIKRSSKKR